MLPLNEDSKKEMERRMHRSACFQRVFRGTDGEFVLNEIDKFGGYKNDTFDPDPYISAYKAGQRALAIFIHNAVEADIKEAERLLKDAGTT